MSDRLKQLVDVAIIQPVVYSEHPVRHRYVLTRTGSELVPILFALADWGDTWAASDSGRPVELTHDDCVHRAEAAVVGRACGHRLTADNVTAGAGAACPGHLRQYFDAAEAKGFRPGTSSTSTDR